MVVNSGDRGPVDALLEERADALRGRFQLVNTSGPGPMGAATNAGVAASDSEYIVLLDDDDSWHPTFLESAVAALDGRLSEDVRGIVTQTMVIEEVVAQQGLPQPTKEKKFNPHLENLKLFHLASVNQFTVNAFLYEREAYDAIGPYREDLPVLDDWEYNLRFLRAYDIDVVAEPLANYHIRVEDREGATANSLTAGERLHKFYEARIAYRLLRDELEAGQIGMGFLKNIAAGHRTDVDIVRAVARRLNSVSDKVGKIDSRTKQMKENGL